MTKVSSKLKVYLYSSLILTGVAVILFTLSYIFAFDSGVGYFRSSPLPSIATSLCFAAVIWFAGTAIFIPKGVLDGASPTTLMASIGATPLCIAELALGALMIIASFAITPNNIFGRIFTDYIPTQLLDKTPLLTVCGILLIIAAAYLALLWFWQDRHSEIKAFIGFSLPISSLFVVAIMYFDLHSPMNSPTKLALQLAFIAFMLFSLFELRIALNKPKPRAYLSLAMITLLLSGISSIPQIVAFAIGRFDNIAYLLYSVLSLCIFIYVGARLIVFVSARDLLERISDQTPTDDEE